MAIISVELESFWPGAVADDLRKLHLLFSLGVVGGIVIGVVGICSAEIEGG